MPLTKICRTCKFEKPYTSFCKRMDARDGLQSRCKECSAEYNAAYYERNKVGFAGRNAEYYEKNKEKERKRKIGYYVKHKTEISKYNAEYSSRHRAEISEYNTKYKVEHKTDPTYKSKRNSDNHRRRARECGATSDNHTHQEVWDRNKGICGICLLPANLNDWHKDHIIPLGPGDDVLDNVRVTHPKCNVEKAATDRRIHKEWSGASDDECIAKGWNVYGNALGALEVA